MPFVISFRPQKRAKVIRQKKINLVSRNASGKKNLRPGDKFIF